MGERLFLEVDPRGLRLPASRWGGADPAKYWRQVHRFGNSFEGMPALEVFRDRGGLLAISDGVTRATRAAVLSPGTTVLVEVTRTFGNKDFSTYPTVGERLP